MGKKRKIVFKFEDKTHSMVMEGVSGREIMLACQDLIKVIEEETGASVQKALAVAYAEQKRDKDVKDES